jgi:dTMP kinase
MKFIVIEGLDGSGKSTQIDKIKTYFLKNKINYHYIHFPRTEEVFFGKLIARFLRGEFGSLETVDPYLVALLYALDRNDAKNEINKWLENDYLVLVDRYVCSNIAFQCAKLKEEMARKQLMQWIINLEYVYHNIPKPAINIFLDVPFSFTKKKLTDQREGDDRVYLNGRADIHEADLEFQSSVRDVYLMQEKTDHNFRRIVCWDEKNEMLSPDIVFLEILAILQEARLIQ